MHADTTLSIICADQTKCTVRVSAVGPSRLLSSIVDDITAAGQSTASTGTAEHIEISTPDFACSTIRSVVSFLEQHRTEPFAEIDPPLRQPLNALIDQWDAHFLSELVSGGTLLPLLQLLVAATYFDIPPLKSLCAAYIAERIQLTAEDDIPAAFGIIDLTQKQISSACAPFTWLQDTDAVPL